MKNILFFSIFILFSAFIFAQNTSSIKDSVKVYGNCDQCKKRIEKTVLKIKGVSKAEWNVASQILHVEFDSSQVQLSKIEETVAQSGHDTEKIRAKDSRYSSLPDCCQYERNKKFTTEKPIKTVRFHITGMSCEEGCAKGIENAVYKMKGVKSSEVNFNSMIAVVIYDSRKVTVAELKQTIENFNPGESGEHKYVAEELN